MECTFPASMFLETSVYMLGKHEDLDTPEKNMELNHEGFENTWNMMYLVSPDLFQVPSSGTLQAM